MKEGDFIIGKIDRVDNKLTKHNISLKSLDNELTKAIIRINKLEKFVDNHL